MACIQYASNMADSGLNHCAAFALRAFLAHAGQRWLRHCGFRAALPVPPPAYTREDEIVARSFWLLYSGLMDVEALHRGLLGVCQQAAHGDDDEQEEASLTVAGLVADACSHVESMLEEDDAEGAAEAAECIMQCMLRTCSEHQAMQVLLARSILQVLRPLAGLAAASESVAGAMLPLLLAPVLHARPSEGGPRPREAIMAVTETLAAYSRGCATTPQHLSLTWLLQQLPQLLQRITRQQIACALECVGPSLVLLTELASQWQQQLQAATLLVNSSSGGSSGASSGLTMVADVQGEARRVLGGDALQPFVDILEFAWRLLQPMLSHPTPSQQRTGSGMTSKAASAAATGAAQKQHSALQASSTAGVAAARKQLMQLGSACLQLLAVVGPVCCVHMPTQAQALGRTAAAASCLLPPAALQQLQQLSMAVLTAVAISDSGMEALPRTQGHQQQWQQAAAPVQPTHYQQSQPTQPTHHQQLQQSQPQQQPGEQVHEQAIHSVQGLTWQQVWTAACAMAAVAAQQEHSDEAQSSDDEAYMGEHNGGGASGGRAVTGQSASQLLQQPTAVACQAGAAVLLWLHVLSPTNSTRPTNSMTPSEKGLQRDSMAHQPHGITPSSSRKSADDKGHAKQIQDCRYSTVATAATADTLTAKLTVLVPPSDRLSMVCTAAGLTHALQLHARARNSQVDMVASLQLLEAASSYASTLLDRAPTPITITVQPPATPIQKGMHAAHAEHAAQQTSIACTELARHLEHAADAQSISRHGELMRTAMQAAKQLVQHSMSELQQHTSNCSGVSLLAAAATCEEPGAQSWQQVLDAPLRTVSITVIHSPDDGLRSLAFRALNAVLSGLPATARALVLVSLLQEPSAPLTALLLQRLRKEAAGGGSVFCAPWVVAVAVQQLIRGAEFDFSAPSGGPTAPSGGMGQHGDVSTPCKHGSLHQLATAPTQAVQQGSSAEEPASGVAAASTTGTAAGSHTTAGLSGGRAAESIVQAVVEDVQLTSLLAHLSAADFGAACDVMASALSVLRLMLLQRHARGGRWPWQRKGVVCAGVSASPVTQQVGVQQQSMQQASGLGQQVQHITSHTSELGQLVQQATAQASELDQQVQQPVTGGACGMGQQTATSQATSEVLPHLAPDVQHATAREASQALITSIERASSMSTATEGASSMITATERASSAHSKDDALLSLLLAAIKQTASALEQQLKHALPVLEQLADKAMSAGALPEAGHGIVPMGAVGPLPDEVLRFTSCCRLQDALTAVVEL